jgi:hypothetical protein
MKKLLYLLMVVLMIFLGACSELPGNEDASEKEPESAPEEEIVVEPEAIINRTTHGIISWDETWRGQIHIVGDIIVESGYTLTIEPGTTITIAAKSDLHNLDTDEFNLKQGIREVLPGRNPDYQGVHPGEPFRDEANHISIHILGTLHAVGTPDQMITITSDSPEPDIWDWNFFTFNKGIMSYCLMEYYRILHTRHGIISHNTLRHVGECAVGLGPFDSGTVIVEHNKISFAGHELIDIQGGNHIIRNNYLGPSPGSHCHSGIVVVSGTPEIYDNKIFGCKSGIVLIGGTPQIIDNYIIGCDEAFLYLSFADGFDIEDNYLLNNKRDIIRNY